MAKIQVTLPDVFTIKHYKALGEHEHLDELEKVVLSVAATTEHSKEEVMQWNINDLLSVYKGVAQMLDDTPQEFFPIFTFKDITYGFQPLSQMNVSEWIDLDRRLEDPVGNLEQILAILYRPITSDRFDGMEWKVRNGIKTLLGKQENMFKYYEIEDYDVEKRDWRADIFEDLPLGVALGCLTFFLGFGMMLQRDLARYSPTMSPTQKKEMIEMLGKALQSLNTSGGSLYYETSVLKSFTSRGKTPF